MENPSANRASNIWGMALILFTVLIHLTWVLYTNYVEEDAFITFRFARQVAAGHGFVYNPGEPIYGSTTPLFTLLLSAWLTFLSDDIILGARFFDLVALTLTLIFTWRTLRTLQRSTAEQFLTLFVCAISCNLIYINTQGMETPLGVSFIAASWYSYVKGNPYLTGLFCGLLLWTRLDLIFWAIPLIGMTATFNLKDALRIGLITTLIYLPWVIFATLYFGSPIPYTLTAKWVAYGAFNSEPYWNGLKVILLYLSPIREEPMRSIGAGLTLGVIAVGLWQNKVVRDKGFLLLVLFILLEAARLTLTRATVFSRYFIPLLWAVLVLFGVSLGSFWDKARTNQIHKTVFSVLFIFMLSLQIISNALFAMRIRERQFFRHDSSLKAMGLWLAEHTPPQSTVLLEPLGYVGYYSERIMIDEVGLVTPAVTDLKRMQIESTQYASIFKPNYVIIHCDEKLRIPPDTVAQIKYRLAETFNPLNYYEGMLNDPNQLARQSCYQIWQNVAQITE